jgi:hypothetical protein
MLRSSGWDAVSPTRARRSRSGRDVTSCRDHRRGAVVPTQEEQAARHICQSTARLSAVRVGSYTLERDAMRRDAARATRRVSARDRARRAERGPARGTITTPSRLASRERSARERAGRRQSQGQRSSIRARLRELGRASQARHSAYATQMLALAAAAPVGKAGCAPVSSAQHLAPPRPTRPDGPPPSAKPTSLHRRPTRPDGPPPPAKHTSLHRPTDSARRSGRRRDLAPPPDRLDQTLHRGRRSTPRSTARPTRPDAPPRSGAGHSATIV